MAEHAVCMEEHEGLHIRKEQMVLQGEKGDAVLKIEIGRLFFSVSMGCKGSEMDVSCDKKCM